MHVTVIMAVHNDALNVRGAVESVVMQTYSDWDLVVVDDGSTDDTLKTLREAAGTDSRISVLTNDVNRGLAYSLNRAWRASHGDLVARLDADDRCLPQRLERQVAAMAADSSIAVLGSAVELVDGNGTIIGKAYRPAEHEALVGKVYKQNPFIHPTVMMRRDYLVATGGYDESLRRAQDYDLWLRSYRHFRFANLQVPLLRYRQRRRPLMSVVVWGTYVLARAARREGRLVADGVYALRFLAASLLAKLGMYDSRLR